MSVIVIKQLKNHLTIAITVGSCQTPDHFIVGSSFTSTRKLLTQSFLRNLAEEITGFASKVKEGIKVNSVRIHFIAMGSLVGYSEE